MMKKSNISKCENCGGDCGTSEGWTDEDRDTEAKENWGDSWFHEKLEDRAIVCDACYQAFMKNFN